METLLNYEAEGMKTPVKCGGYENDVSREVTDPAGGKTGLQAGEVISVSSVLRLSRGQHSDLWHQENFLPRGLKLDVQLVPDRPAFVIKTISPVDPLNQFLYNYNILAGRFLIQFKKLSTDMVKSHKEMV